MRSDRLLELAAHLKSGRRGHKFFDLGLVTAGPRDEERHGCGSAGCAFGELPVVWPEAWEFVQTRPNSNPFLYSVRLKSDQSHCDNSMSDRGACESRGACEWFDLGQNEIDALFYADRELVEDSPIESLSYDATAEEVADRFIAFVKWREEQAAQEVKTDA